MGLLVTALKEESHFSNKSQNLPSSTDSDKCVQLHTYNKTAWVYLVVRLQYRLPRVFVTNIAFLISRSSMQAVAEKCVVLGTIPILRHHNVVLFPTQPPTLRQH